MTQDTLTTDAQTAPEVSTEAPLESYVGQRFRWIGHPRTPELSFIEIAGIGALADVVLVDASGEIRRQVSPTTFRIELRHQVLQPIDDAQSSALEEAPTTEIIGSVPVAEEQTIDPFQQARDWLSLGNGEIGYASLEERNARGIDLAQAIALQIGCEVTTPAGVTGAKLTEAISQTLKDMIDPMPGKDPVIDATPEEIQAAVEAEGAERFANAHPGIEARLTETEITNQVLNPVPLERECATHGPWAFDGTPEGSECPGCAKAWIEERAAYEKRVEGQTCANDFGGHKKGAPVLECPGCEEAKASVDSFFQAHGFVPKAEPTPKQKRGRKKSDQPEQADAQAPTKEPETFEELKAARDRARAEVDRYEAKMRAMLDVERARKLAELDELNRLGSELGLTA